MVQIFDVGEVVHTDSSKMFLFATFLPLEHDTKMAPTLYDDQFRIGCLCRSLEYGPVRINIVYIIPLNGGVSGERTLSVLGDLNALYLRSWIASCAAGIISVLQDVPSFRTKIVQEIKEQRLRWFATKIFQISHASVEVPLLFYSVLGTLRPLIIYKKELR